MTPNEVAAAARAMIAGNAQLEATMRDEWATVETRIYVSIAGSKRLHKNYAAHHVLAKARLAMLTAIAEGKPPYVCATLALAAVGL